MIRKAAPIQIVVCAIGLVLLVAVVGIIILAVVGTDVPDELGTVCIASMTALGGLLAPNTGLLTDSRTARQAAQAGEAAAAAVVQTHEQLPEPGQHRADL